jgi:hypothetical protein
VSFFPLKGKSSEAVATALRSFFSLQGVPLYLYTDNDQSFRGSVEILVSSFNITHITSHPYTQKQNYVEAQVRKLKNLFRAITNNPVFSHKEWHILYPLVIIRFNTLITKYGLTRELVHYASMNDNHLPLIVDTQLDTDLQQDLDQMSYQLQGKIKKFLRNKVKSKDYYKKPSKDHEFLINELVMRLVYVPQSAFHPVFKGPYRIIKLLPKGATLKDPRTGEILSVYNKYIRKLTASEFLELLPDNFDNEILKHLDLYKYNRNAEPDRIQSAPIEEVEKLDTDTILTEEQDNELTEPQNIRKLRNGKTIKLYHFLTNQLKSTKIKKMIFSGQKKVSIQSKPLKPILSQIQRPPPSPHLELDQYWAEESWIFSSIIRPNVNENIRNYKKRLKSNFQSPYTGTLEIDLDEDSEIPCSKKKVTFSKITVNFY